MDPVAGGMRRCLATVEHGDGRSEPFRWAVVGADAMPRLVAASALAIRSRWRSAGRAFVELTRE